MSAAEVAQQYGALLTTPAGQVVLHVTPERYHELVAALRADGYDVCIDVTAVDYLIHPGRRLPEGVVAQRFEVVANLLSTSARQRVRVRCQVAEATPMVATIADLYASADAAEREVYDMFGIAFDGHPDLTRILMPEDWEGHPLRKDYAVGRIPVQFKAAGRTR